MVIPLKICLIRLICFALCPNLGVLPLAVCAGNPAVVSVKPSILIRNRLFYQAAFSAMRPNSHERQAHRAHRPVNGSAVLDCQAMMARPALAHHHTSRLPLHATPPPTRFPHSPP